MGAAVHLGVGRAAPFFIARVSMTDIVERLLRRLDMGLSTKWKTTIDDAIANKAWDDYDKLIKAEVMGKLKR